VYPSPVNKQKSSNESSIQSKRDDQKEQPTPLSEKHELEDRYDHNIQWEREQWKDSAKWGYILAAVGILLLPLLAKSFLFIFLLLVPLSYSYAMFLGGLPHLLEARRFEKFKVIALSYPAHVSNEVGSAYNNVSPWLVNPKEQGFDPKLLARLCARYVELEKLSTEELWKKLDEGGVWSPQNGWFGIGRTLDEGLMMALYTRRADKEKVEIEATKATHTAISLQAATAPDLQTRKWAEQQKEALAQELGALEGEPDDSFNWPLKRISGEVRVYTRAGEAVAAVFTLPRGVYRLDIKDEESSEERKPQRLRIEDALFELKISPSIKKGEIEITAESGITDSIPLY
jgi:hypothetical protein